MALEVAKFRDYKTFKVAKFLVTFEHRRLEAALLDNVFDCLSYSFQSYSANSQQFLNFSQNNCDAFEILLPMFPQKYSLSGLELLAVI